MLPLSLLLCLAALVPSSASAADAPSCELSLPTLSNKYDLTPLSALQTIESTQKTPPTETTHRVRMKICGGEGQGLGKEEGVDDDDQCPADTYVCLQIQNTKPNSTPPLRTLSVIPIAGSPSFETAWEEKPITCPEGTPKETKKCFDLVGTLKGGSYNDQPQSLLLTLSCNPTASDPTFASYADNVLSVRWESPDACPRSPGEAPPSGGGGGGDAKKGGGMGFFGWFFLLLLLGPPIYLGLGIYHNRTTYDARGWDMLPHREFWRDFPGLVHDLVSHLLGGFTGSRKGSGGGGGGSGRGGYESL